jgi:hypothetical protein
MIDNEFASDRNRNFETADERIDFLREETQRDRPSLANRVSRSGIGFTDRELRTERQKAPQTPVGHVRRAPEEIVQRFEVLPGAEMESVQPYLTNNNLRTRT